MNRSETLTKIAPALVKFQHEVATIAKSSENPFFKSKYAALPDILEAIREPLHNNGLAVIQFPKGENEMETMVIHDSGEFMSESYYMKPVKADPQAYGSVITYQRRYALGAVLGLNIDDDDDGNKASEPTKKEDERPWMDNKLFNQAVSKLQSGALIPVKDKGDMNRGEFVEYLKGSYRMKRDYSIALEQELNSEMNLRLAQ